MSFQLGIVVQNNDPKKRGRVKVFVPHLSLNYKEGWEDTNEDKTFDRLSGTQISNVIDSIKHLLPWANYAAPIIGENGNHYYNAASKKTDDVVDDKPSTSVSENDKWGVNFRPSSYDDAAKGAFSIPKVGSKVWVFFENGNPQRPVYFATSYSDSDWDIINNDSGDYPDELENNPEGTSTAHKNKFVISQRGAVVEIINTESKEAIKVSDYNGNFKVTDSSGAKELVNGEDKKKVTSNQTLHVGGNMNIYVEGNVNMEVEGTYYVESKGNMEFKAPRIDFNK